MNPTISDAAVEACARKIHDRARHRGSALYAWEDMQPSYRQLTLATVRESFAWLVDTLLSDEAVETARLAILTSDGFTPEACMPLDYREHAVAALNGAIEKVSSGGS